MAVYEFTQNQFNQDIERLANLIHDSGLNIKKCLGICQGGIPVAMALAKELNCDYGDTSGIEVSDPSEFLIVDDLVDSGDTINPWLNAGFNVAVLGIKKQKAQISDQSRFFYINDFGDNWVQFWWEPKDKEFDAKKLITRVLQHIGEDPLRNGLLETPKRVVKSWEQLYGGYDIDPKTVFKEFDEPVRDDLVIMRNITFSSTCEHHMLPFMGKAHIAYIPNGNKVIGASKMIRLLEIYAHRLQIQERIAQQVCDALEKYLDCLGCACIIEAVHSCILCRGVQNDTAELVTPVLRGEFRKEEKAALRAELYANISR